MKNSKILVIAPIMFHYHEALINELKKDNEIMFFADQPQGALTALLRKVNSNYSSLYYKKILKKIKDFKFDYFLMINGKGVTREFLIELRKLSKNAKFITYQWDSIARNQIERKTDYRYFLDLFDKSYSFDYEDVENIESLDYLPTFHTATQILENWIEREIDYLMVASYTKERYSFVKKVKKEFIKRNLNFACHLYIPWHHYLRNIVMKGEYANPKYLKFHTLSKTEVLNMYLNSKSTIDIQYKYQKGYTMRVIEGLAYGCKIFTTNKDIIKENFYSNNSIKIFDQKDFWKVFDKDFLDRKVFKNEEIEKFNLTNWIENVFK